MSFKIKILCASAWCIAGICISEQSCFATDINTLGDFKRLVYQNCWGAWASKNANNTFQKKEECWYRDETFSTSIFDEIGTAIADCMTVNNEFNLAVQRRQQNSNAIVEFTINPNSYNQNNWNGVVLYNYLAEAVWGFLSGYSYGYSEKCIDAVGNIIKSRYREIANINDYIDTAVDVIKMYAKDLDLYSYVYKLQMKALTIRDPNSQNSSMIRTYPDLALGGSVHLTTAFDTDWKSAEFGLYNVLTTIDNKLKWTPINLKVRNGKVVEYQTPFGIYRHMTKNMQLSDKKSVDQSAAYRYKYKDLTKTNNSVNTAETIHNLHNQLTCHINSFITALSRSDLFRQAIKQVAQIAKEQPKALWFGQRAVQLQFCRILNEIIEEGIDNGWMAHNNENGKAYYDLKYKELKKILSEVIAAISVRQSINTNLNDGTLEKFVQETVIKNAGTIENYIAQRIKIAEDSSQITSGLQKYEPLAELLPVISYEMDVYGVPNVLSHSLIKLCKSVTQQSAGSQAKVFYRFDHCTEGSSGNISTASDGLPYVNAIKTTQKTKLGGVLQDVMDNATKEPEQITLTLSDNSNIAATRLTSARIEELPDVLCVLMPDA